MNNIIFSIKSQQSPAAGNVDYPTAIDTALINVVGAELLLSELCETKRLNLPVAQYLLAASDSALNMLIFSGEVLGYYLAAGKPVAALHYSVRISQVKINCFNQVLKRIEALEHGWKIKAAWEYGLRTGEAKYNDMWGTTRTEGAPWRWE